VSLFEYGVKECCLVQLYFFSWTNQVLLSSLMHSGMQYIYKNGLAAEGLRFRPIHTLRELYRQLDPYRIKGTALRGMSEARDVLLQEGKGKGSEKSMIPILYTFRSRRCHEALPLHSLRYSIKSRNHLNMYAHVIPIVYEKILTRT